MSKNNDMKMLEEKIQAIVKESVQEKFNSVFRDGLGSNDGRYHYQGTGSEESQERMKKIRDKKPSELLHMTDKVGGKQSQWDTLQKEHGGLESIPSNPGDSDSDSDWGQFISSLRDLASRNDYAKGSQYTPYYIKSMTEKLQTKEGAKAFLAFLYKNGLKKDWGEPWSTDPHKQAKENTVQLSQSELNEMIQKSVREILNRK